MWDLKRAEASTIFADARAHAIVDFTRQQAQRQADHAAVVLEHALDGTVRLAGVGRTEQRDALGGIRQRHDPSMPRDRRLEKAIPRGPPRGAASALRLADPCRSARV